MFEHHKKESPIISLAGVGGGPASYIFYSASGGGSTEVKEISRSLRFNGEDSSNLPKLARNGTAGNQKTWTFSTWLKRGATGSRDQIFSAAGSHNTYIEFQSNKLMIEDYSPGVNFKVQLRRHFIDSSAWYHIVVVVDTTINSPASDRVKIYVNGRRETEFEGTPTYPSQDYLTSVNDTGEHKIGQFPGNTNFPFKGYLADVHLVDGTAVTETNGVIDEFGFFDAYNVWQPKAYTASHGNNGFNLTFSDTSSDAAIGTDSAGSNNYTPTNLVAAAGPAANAIDLDGDDALLFPGPGTVSGDFTAEIFMKASSYAGIQRILSANEGSNSGEYFNMRAYNGNTEFYFKSGVSASGTNLPTNQWNHIAMTRSGSTISYYLNGSRWATDTSSDSINITTLCVGIGYGSEYFTGQVSNARFVNGQALYTGANYTVPTATLTTTSQGATASNVKLLAATTSTVTENAGTEGNATSAGDPAAITASVFGDAAGIDVLRDSPANLTAVSGNNIGNYCTLNPLDRQSTNGTLANGNLDLQQTSSSWAMYRGTMSMSSGKWYWEVTFGNDQYSMIGIIPTDYLMSTNSNYWPAQVPNGYTFYPYTGNKYDNTSLQNYASADQSGTGDTYGIALDLDAGTMTYYKNGSSLGQAHSSMRADTYAPVAALYNQSNFDSYNFGQRPFLYPPGSTGGPPATYKALCSQNLSTVGAGSTLFDISLWTGDNAPSTRVVTDTLSFTPDMVWGKQRSQPSRSHQLFDSARGAGSGKDITPNERHAEGYDSATYGYLNSFDTNGFTVAKGSDSSGGNNYWNASSLDYVAWSWKAGGAPTTNNVAAAGQVPTAGSAKVDGANMTTALAGTIQITRLTANTLTGLSIITFENPSSQETLGHGLGKKPEMMWVKSRDTSGNSNPWQVYHRGVGNNGKLYLDGTDSIVSSSVWGTTDPTSTLFTLNDNVADSWVAYVWTSVEGFSYFGAYEGGSGTVFVPCGFQPKWVMVKNADRSGEEWIILDRERDPTNVAGHTMYANHPTYEVDYRTGGNARSVSFLSNGFQVHNGNPLLQSGTHIFAAFAEDPFQSARAR